MKNITQHIKLMGIIWLIMAFIIPAAISFSAEVIFEAEIPTPSEGLYIYKMKIPNINLRKAVKKLGRVIPEVSKIEDFDEEDFSKTKDRYVFNRGPIHISSDSHGTEIYYSNFDGLKLTEHVEQLPKEEEAAEIAQRYLLGTGLLRKLKRRELQIDHIGGINQAQADIKGNVTEEKKAVVVYYYRQLNKLRVMNAGSSISVTIGDLSKPVGLQFHWRDIDEAQLVPNTEYITDPAKIKEYIVADINNIFSDEAKIVITSVEIGYYENNSNFIQPAYCYNGEVVEAGGDIQPMPVKGFVQALNQPPEPVHHPAYIPDVPQPKEVK